MDAWGDRIYLTSTIDTIPLERNKKPISSVKGTTSEKFPTILKNMFEQSLKNDVGNLQAVGHRFEQGWHSIRCNGQLYVVDEPVLNVDYIKSALWPLTNDSLYF